MTWPAVEASLRAVAETVAARPPGERITLRWGPLFASLDGGGDDFAEAIELIYEGYLVHYRTARAVPRIADDRQAALLAGDVFYARGLRIVAVSGDVASVALLTRLMSACSYLRSTGSAFEDDDALWAYTVAALAAVRAGVAPHRARSFFDDLDAKLAATGSPGDVVSAAAAAAATLDLPDPAPLEAAFTGLAAPAARAAR